MNRFSDKDGKKTNKEKAYKEAKQQIRAKVRESRRKLRELGDRESFEELLKRQSENRAAERREQRKRRAARKAEREGSPVIAEDDGEVITAYKAKAHAQNYEPKVFREGFFRRAVRLVKSLHAARKRLKNDTLVTAEKKRRVYADIVKDCASPVVSVCSEVIETAYSFFTVFCRDLWEVILFLIDQVIAAGYYIHSFMLLIWDWFWDLRFWLDLHKRGVFQIFAGLVCLGILVVVFISSLVGYEYSYYGRVLGVAKTREDVYKTIEVLGDKLSAVTGANVSLDVERDIEFNKLIGFDLDIDTPDDILDTLTYMKDIQVKAFAVMINGAQTVVLEDEKSANSLLESVKNDFLLGRLDTEYIEAHFEEEVGVEEVSVVLGDIWNITMARRYLETGTVNSVALDTDKALLTVVSTELYTSFESINFGTRYINNSELYADEKELVSEGRPGKQENVTQIVRRNGVESGRELVSSVRIEEPVAEVYYKGTKAIPQRSGTGTFAYPIKTYTITSRFGMRWGKMHTGVDFAASIGTKLFATDGGTVTFTGTKGGYGQLVIIDHGGFYESYYAHCSEILVNVGDKVYQGQNIALVGNTGNSTGPHLHFEIRYKGEPGNPLDFL